MKGFKYYNSIDDSLEKVLKSMKKTKNIREKIEFNQSLDRIIALDVVASENIPRFNRAAMDGYAVISEDTFGSTENNPSILKIAGKVAIDKISTVDGEKGKAIAVSTGSNMPFGTDSVVMVEYTKKEKEKLLIFKAVVPNQNVSNIGEDIKKGQVVLKKGIKITPQDIGIFAALGQKIIEVVKKPNVAVISTGDELIEIGEELKDAKIYDINRHMTIASLIKLGANPLDFGIVKDNLNDITNTMKKALSQAEMVLISAGTSVGEKDLVANVLESLSNKNEFIHGVSLRPGYPTGLTVIDGKPVISLPGYPVSNAIAFRVFVNPIIAHILGTKEEIEKTIRAILTRRVVNRGGLRTFVRVKIILDENKIKAEPIMSAGASILSSLTDANGLLVIPEDTEGVDEGEEVEIILIR